MRNRHQWLTLSVLCLGLVTSAAEAPARVKVYDLPRGFVPSPPVRDPDGRLLFVAGACCKPGDYRGIFGIIDGSGNVRVLRKRDDPSVDLNLGLFGPDGNMYDAYGSGGLVRHALHGGVPDDAVTRIKTGTSKPVGSVALGYDGAIWFASEAGTGGRFVGRLDLKTDGVRLYTRGLRSSPTTLTRGPRRSLWFSDNHGRLWRVSMDGGLHRVAAPADRYRVGVAGDEHGVWLLHYDPRTTRAGLLHLDASGRLRRTCPLPRVAPGQAVASGGSLWLVTAGRVWRVSASGVVVRGPRLMPANGWLSGVFADRAGGLTVGYATDHRQAGHMAVVDRHTSGTVVCRGLRGP